MLGIRTGMRVQLLLAASGHYKEIRGVALLDLYSDTSPQDLEWSCHDLDIEQSLIVNIELPLHSPR